MLSHDLHPPPQMSVWSDNAFSTARHKLHVSAADEAAAADIVSDAHRRLPDHMIVTSESASIAPISLPLESSPPHIPITTSRSHAPKAPALDISQLQKVAAKLAEELGRVFLEIAPTPPGDGWQPSQRISFDTVHEAANNAVMHANQTVADANTDEEFDNAVDNLHSAVHLLEKVANLIYKSAAIAHTMNRTVGDPS
ncbi:unnamed protein product [Agarophyton chilense]